MTAPLNMRRRGSFGDGYATGNSEGTIFQRKDGRWAAAATVDGKQRYVYAKSRREAQQKLRELQSNLDRGILPPEKLTLREYLDRWLKDVAKPSVRATTYCSYEQLLRIHVIPLLGRVKLHELQPAHIQKLHAAMQSKDLSRSTVQRTHRVLHSALNRALAWEYVQRNVASVVHPPTPEEDKVRTFDPAQVKQLLSVAHGTRWEALLTLAIATGLRQGELLALKWSDVDLDIGLLQVQRQLGTDKTFSEPKTRTARRSLYLPSSTIAILSEHKLRQDQERALVGQDWRDQDLLFCTHQGQPLRARNVVREYKALVQRAGLPDLRFHDLRHTAAKIDSLLQ